MPRDGQLGRHPLSDGTRDRGADQPGSGQAVRGVLIAAAQTIDDQVGLATADQLGSSGGDRPEHGQPASGDRIPLLVNDQAPVTVAAHRFPFPRSVSVSAGPHSGRTMFSLSVSGGGPPGVTPCPALFSE